MRQKRVKSASKVYIVYNRMFIYFSVFPKK